jgi:hypothetical protein
MCVISRSDAMAKVTNRSTEVTVLDEVSIDPPGDWHLCFQRVLYVYGDGRDPEYGYRFMYRRDDGTLQAARGQARIESFQQIRDLMLMAEKAGWGKDVYHYDENGKLVPPAAA